VQSKTKPLTYFDEASLADWNIRFLDTSKTKAFGLRQGANNNDNDEFIDG